MTEKPVIHLSGNVEEPVNVGLRAHRLSPRCTLVRQPWQWTGSPGQDAGAGSLGLAQSLCVLRFKSMRGGDQERAISEAGRKAEEWRGNERQ